jgi:hypothetical protein
MTTMRIKSWIAALALALPMASSHAITYGTVDGTRHPFVGALVGEFDGGMYPYCSGTLISPTVFLTAAHCDLGTGRVFVSFDPAITGESKLLAGTFHANPEYNASQDDPLDLAVVVLDKPVHGVAPARLPAFGQFNRVAKNQRFTAVGYGSGEVVNQPGGPVNPYIDIREYAVSEFNAVGPGYLRLSQNPATGDGGTCYGDSGGPNFLGAGAQETTLLAGTTITGDALCKASNVIQRLDTTASRRFLSRFVTLP